MSSFAELDQFACGTLNALIQALPDSADELVLNSHSQIYYCCGRDWEALQSPFANEAAYWDWLRAFLWHEGQVINFEEPVAGGVYRGFRWHALLPPLTQGEPIFAFRRILRHGILLQDFGATPDDAELIRRSLIEAGPCIIFGPTAAGKTTLLLCLLEKFLGDRRVTILQRGAELPLRGGRWVFLATEAASDRKALRQLFEEVLRLRPEAICFSELRGLEAASLVDAVQSLAVPIVTTIHGSSVSATWSRLQGLVQEGMGSSDLDSTMESIRRSVTMIELGVDRRLRGIFRTHGTDDWRNLLTATEQRPEQFLDKPKKSQ